MAWKRRRRFYKRKKRVRCKTEKKLLAWLQHNMSEVKTTYQPKYDWCRNVGKTERYFPFDFSIEEYRLIIEVDGRQHYFKARRSWNPDAIQERDLYKMECAIKEGYTVVRIVQEDIWNDRNDWEERLIWHLRAHKIPRAVLLDSDDKAEFDPLREKMRKTGMIGTNF